MSAIWERTPLPAEHAVTMIAGLILHARTRPRLPAALAPVGWVGLAAGLGLNVWAVRARGEGDIDAPDRLVTAGPYALTRNPMYVGWSLLHLGAGLAARSPWLLAGWPVAAALVHRAVLREERQLAALFGDEHAGYARRVPRY
ncbi:methyltransferase family protein [Actinokineospora sp. HUAS TT18]|uniref:methyltransferase family protein n=1 Tax=Actinokineospora sp. HUAS TT18 TaxID=3447451 RepID=UPI003F51BE22